MKLIVALLLLHAIGKPIMSKDELKKEEVKYANRRDQERDLADANGLAMKARKVLMSKYKRYKSATTFSRHVENYTFILSFCIERKKHGNH